MIFIQTNNLNWYFKYSSCLSFFFLLFSNYSRTIIISSIKKIILINIYVYTLLTFLKLQKLNYIFEVRLIMRIQDGTFSTHSF